jgi:lysophospholipase L1-like esterase
MKRRNALAAICAALAGCGGGGSSEEEAPSLAEQTPAPANPPPAAPAPVQQPTPEPSPTPEPAPAPEPAPEPPPASPNIAVWGDSLSRYAAHLPALVPARLVYDGHVDGQKSPQIAARQLADTEHTPWINVLCYGRNNISPRATVLADIAASVAHLAPNTRFLVLSIWNNTFEPLGTAGYSRVIALSNELALAYPDNFLDVRAFLVSQFDPNNAQDLIDHANDVPPSSLRSDALHLNLRGEMLLAQHVKAAIEARGW